MSQAEERERAERQKADFFSTLIEGAANFRSQADQDAAMATYLAMLAQDRGVGLRIAGNRLHQHCRLMRDRRWIAAATSYYPNSKEGAWGLLTSAALYNTHLFELGILEWLHEHASDDAYGYCVCLLRLGMAWPERAAELRGHVDSRLASAPEEALRAIDAVTRWSPDILDQAMALAALAHFSPSCEPALSIAVLAAQRYPESFTAAVLDQLAIASGDRAELVLKVLWVLWDGPAGAARATELMQRYLACMQRSPSAVIDAAQYHFQGERLVRITGEFVATLCALMRRNAYPAFTLLRRACKDAKHLITSEVIAAAIAAIPDATNYAFWFFHEAITISEDLTRSCTLALFECLLLEPINRAFVREEQIDALQVTFERSDLKCTLDALLADPPRFGSRRARVLMAVMFRSRQRARRRVLLEALRFAATCVITIKDPITGERRRVDAVWRAFLFLIDQGPGDAISSEAPSSFLESAYQLNYLNAVSLAPRHFVADFDLEQVPSVSFGPGLEFLDQDPELSQLHARVRTIAARFGVCIKLPACEAYLGRQDADERECASLERVAAAAPSEKAERMRKRLETLRRTRALRASHPEAALAQDGLGLAHAGAAARAGTGAVTPGHAVPHTADAAEAAHLLACDRKALRKHLATQLASEAVRIMVGSLERTKLAFYHSQIVALLGNEIAVESIDQRVLPAFLWLTAVERDARTKAGLVRLIEDRLRGREHSWLRDCPEARAWANNVHERLPAAAIERWRAPYERRIDYEPGLGGEERGRRMAADLEQTRALLERAGGEPVEARGLAELSAIHEALRARMEMTPKEGQELVDATALEEARTNLQRVRMAEIAPLSDFAGTLTFRVESDPIEILYMGEYGFASCLALRGSNAYSAVANAVDIDKTVIWVLDSHGNVIARRLIALTPAGMLMYRVYTNRPGMHLDRLVNQFTAEYAQHCQVPIIHQGQPGPLLSDRWYNDGPV